MIYEYMPWQAFILAHTSRVCSIIIVSLAWPNVHALLCTRHTRKGVLRVALFARHRTLSILVFRLHWQTVFVWCVFVSSVQALSHLNG